MYSFYTYMYFKLQIGTIKPRLNLDQVQLSIIFTHVAKLYVFDIVMIGKCIYLHG